MTASTTVFFDTETAGLADEAATIQLAAIAVRDWKELAVFEQKIEFDVSKAEPEALELNHFDAEVWELEAYPVQEVVASFAKWLEPHRAIEMVSKRTGRPYMVARLAGHNVKTFDAPRLQAMFKAQDVFLAADSFRPLDTVQLALWECWARGKKPPNYQLATLCGFIGIDVGEAHDALADVRMCIELARALLEG